LKIKLHYISSILIILLFFTSSITLAAHKIENETKINHTIYQNPTAQSTNIIIYVDDDNTQGPWDGTQNHPYQYIQDAINHAQPKDQIYVFNGTYYEHLHINKPLTIQGESNQHTIIDGYYISHIIYITSHNVTLAHFTIQHSGITTNDAAIYISHHHTILKENIIQHNNYGIIITTSQNSLVYNNFQNNKNHAYILTNNTISYNYWDDHIQIDLDENGIADTQYKIPGDNTADTFPLIHPYGTITNLDTKEIFFNIQSAIDSPNTLTQHTIQLKPETYHEHIIINKSIILHGSCPTNTIIDGSKSDTIIKLQTNNSTIKDITIQNSGINQTDNGIILQGHNNLIFNTYIKNNYIGITLYQSQKNNIIQNKIIQNHWVGLIINHNSHHTTIHHNIFQSNGYAGVGINLSTENLLYLNDFVNNPHHAYDDSHNHWDNGYPIGGNYWDDYTGKDKDYDEIGDTPYPIKGGINEDRYPLMYPLEPYDLSPPTIIITRPTNGLYIRERHLLQRLLQKIIVIGQVTIWAQANDEESGITQVKFYLNNEPYPAYIGYEPPFHWHWTKRTIIPDIHQIKAVAFNGAKITSTHIIQVKRYL
jgi:nitrous oxidase accessory protein NosD